MHVATCLLSLHIPGSRSLKDKRQVIRSVLERTRNKFGVAVAEVDDNDAWQSAVLGIAAVSGDSGHALEIVRGAVDYIEESRPDIEVVSAEIEVASFKR